MHWLFLVWLVATGLVLLLLLGGVFGLKSIGTYQWGGLPLTLLMFVGTVVGGMPLERAWNCLTLYAEQVLPAFTSNVANILRLHDRGRIDAGKAADAIVLDDNDDIHDVMIAGIWHVKDGEQQIFGQFEEQGGAQE